CSRGSCCWCAGNVARLARLLRSALLDIVLDLPRVDLEMVGVDLQPVLGAVAPGLRVGPDARPRFVGQTADQRGGSGADRVDDRERGLERQVVIVEDRGPVVLVVAPDARAL